MNLIFHFRSQSFLFDLHRFALNVRLFKMQQKLSLIVIFAFSVHCSIKKFRFHNFFFSIRSRVSVSQLFRLGRDYKVSKFLGLDLGLENVKRSRSRSRTKQSRQHP